MLGFFLLFPFAFIFFSLITHTLFSFLENYLNRTIKNRNLRLLLNHCKEKVIKTNFTPAKRIKYFSTNSYIDSS